MALSERQPQASYHQPDQEQEITLYAGEDRHPVSMSCYERQRFYIGGLRAQLESIQEETIVFAVTVETARKGRITRRYDLTGAQFCHLLYGTQQPAAERIGLLEATTRLGTSPTATSTQPGQEHEQRTPPRTRSRIR